MSKDQYRIAVIGAATLLGKEVGDEIAESPLASATTLLLDNEEESGTLEAVGDEASFIQPLEPAALENVDVAIFTDASMLREQGRTARQLGAAVVDATGSTEFAPGAPVRSPLLGEGTPLDLETTSVRVAHPVATMLAPGDGSGVQSRVHSFGCCDGPAARQRTWPRCCGRTAATDDQSAFVSNRFPGSSSMRRWRSTC